MFCSCFKIAGGSVVGYAVSCQGQEEFTGKLQIGDEIEGCPTEYQRDVVDVRLVDEEKTVKAFVYHRAACRRDSPITSGDWLKRDGVRLNPEMYSNRIPSL